MDSLFESLADLVWKIGAGSCEVLHVRFRAAFSIIQHQVCGHFPLQTGDVPMAEVITQVMHLQRQHSHFGEEGGLKSYKSLYLKLYFFIYIYMFEPATITHPFKPWHSLSLTPAGENVKPEWPESSVERNKIHKYYTHNTEIDLLPNNTSSLCLTKLSSSGLEEKIGFSDRI